MHAYDHQDRLLAHKSFRPDGAISRDSSYDYDALDRPVKQTERHGTSGTEAGSRTTELTYLD